jgi:opacity protein-like surface antigen
MLKKLLLLSSALGYFSTAFAGATYVSPTFFIERISANHSSYRDANVRLSAGYATFNRNNYFAAEVFVVPSTLTLTDNKNTGATSAHTSRSLGASLISGRILPLNLLGFGRLGVISTKFSSTNRSKLGTQLGLGIQGMLTQNWILRGEYIHTMYGSVSQIGTPNSNELGVGLIYWFA